MTGSIDWDAFAADVRMIWDRPSELRIDCGFASQATTICAWHGRSIGLVPFLTICREMERNPIDYLQPEKDLAR